MDALNIRREVDGYVLRHKKSKGIRNMLTTVETKQRLAKKLTYKLKEIIFVLFITILVPVVIIVISLVVSCFYINHFQANMAEALKNGYKRIEHIRRNGEMSNNSCT